jgi:cation diffusion facilitator CzcD-associated flavoprotein CzcO
MDEKTKDIPFTPQVHNLDMVIVGAGISGINAAYRYQTAFPSSPYVVLEARMCMGGTWDLMRYPGIRSDSDLYTFGFAWRPWPNQTPIAEAGEILEYMNESAAQYGIDKRILYSHKLREARWTSKEQQWTLDVKVTNDIGKESTKRFRAKYIVLGTGYVS